MNEYLNVLKKYAMFSGRARRREYWMFILFNVIVSFILGFIDGFAGWQIGEGRASIGVLSTIYSLAVFIPSIAVSIRRLHDIGRSGWWLLIGLIPIVGSILLIVWDATEGEPGSNIWGPNPKESVSAYGS